MRQPAIFHCTSEPYRFFGRRDELALLEDALAGGKPSVVAFVGPGGQGKTAIVRHWLDQAASNSRWDEPGGSRPPRLIDGVFFWSFYRGKDSDLCLRELWAYAEGTSANSGISASFCVDHLLPRLRQERWALVLDGTEVVQHEQGSWRGRFLHPELGRLLEELASEPMPGVVVLTTRFELPTLSHRHHASLVSLSTLDLESACHLLESLGVQGSQHELQHVARSGGLHAKAVELIGTYLVRYHEGTPSPVMEENEQADEESFVSGVLARFQEALSQEEKDILALATAFRHPPKESQLLTYLVSNPVHHLLHDVWKRTYVPFRDRPEDWLTTQLQTLVELRLLERVGLALMESAEQVLDAHPLVRRGFEDALGEEGRRHGATSRAGFLRGRPDRRPPASLEEAREEVELFHSYCDAGMWNEADSTYVALDNPKHRLAAPAFERDLLLRFFPEGDWRQPPLWSGFGRHRSLAICLEMLGQFEDAIEIYRPQDEALRGDALIALGQLTPILDKPQMPAPWQTLWQAYRVHALALAGRTEDALHAAGTLVPGDVYEWVHLFEGLARLNRLDLIDATALQFQFKHNQDSAWGRLSWQRMLLEYQRWQSPTDAALETPYRELIEAYDRAGLPWERALVRLHFARWLVEVDRKDEAAHTAGIVMDLAARHRMLVIEKDARALLSISDKVNHG